MKKVFAVVVWLAVSLFITFPSEPLSSKAVSDDI